MKAKWIVLFFTGIFILGTFIGAQSPELRARFLQRKPFIDGLKNQGSVGENNIGKLTPRTALNAQAQQIVNAENADRDTVYGEIAQKLNVSPIEVGRRRAVQIAEMAAPGHWLQDAAGNWYQKR